MGKGTTKPTREKLATYRPQQVNANKHTHRGMSMLEGEIRKVGYVAPMTAAADGEIFDGSARLETSADVYGLDVEPIVIHSDGTRPIIHVRDDIPTASDPRAVAASLAANRIAEVNLAWDSDAIQALQQQGADLSAYFREEELLNLLQSVDITPIDAPALPDGDKGDYEQMTFTLHRDQAITVRAAIDAAKEAGSGSSDLNENSNGNALAAICEAYRG